MLKENKSENLDDPNTTLEHREIILNKPFLKKLYTEWYSNFKNYTNDLPEGKVIEIGSGGGFLKDVYPEVITSDIMPLSVCDMTFSAENILFEDNTVSAIFMLNVLHHIPDAEKVFSEAQRVLKKGGVIYMVEPAATPFSTFFYKKFHHEPFNPKMEEWKFESSGPLSDANGALPWIIFKRDYGLFAKRFPQLALKKLKVHTPMRYLVSGGLSFKSLFPGWAFGGVSVFEKIFTPLYPLIGMFQTIIVEKK